MFGEYESESPRVPSPWDSLMSSPRSLSPSKPNGHWNDGNLAINTTQTLTSLQLPISPLLLPRLVPEDDSGSIEYKLHLLNPSPARFTRLVTQLKWRLLEGGGQAYYELGVADSGDLIGLGKQELESSLDTLEMMAGEIGASVIVVKEIEVPAELAARYEEDARSRGQPNTWGDARGKRARRREKELMVACLYDDDPATAFSMSPTSTTNTETEEDSNVMDDCGNEELQRPTASCHVVPDLADPTAMFAIDLELEFNPADAADVSETDDGKLPRPPLRYIIDLGISLVYKPRPMRKRFHHIHPGHHHLQTGSGRSVGKKGKKVKEKDKQHLHSNNSVPKDSSTTNGDGSAPPNKTSLRRQARDKRREERKQTLLARAARGATEAPATGPTPATTTSPTPTAASKLAENAQAGAKTLAETLEALLSFTKPNTSRAPNDTTFSVPSLSTTPDSSNTTVVNTPPADGLDHRTANNQDIAGDSEPVHIEDDDEEVFSSPIMLPSASKSTEVPNAKTDTKSIIEVLVVRKMSMEEGFLDFEGFSFL